MIYDFWRRALHSGYYGQAPITVGEYLNAAANIVILIAMVLLIIWLLRHWKK